MQSASSSKCFSLHGGQSARAPPNNLCTGHALGLPSLTLTNREMMSTWGIRGKGLPAACFQPPLLRRRLANGFWEWSSVKPCNRAGPSSYHKGDMRKRMQARMATDGGELGLKRRLRVRSVSVSGCTCPQPIHAEVQPQIMHLGALLQRR